MYTTLSIFVSGMEGARPEKPPPDYIRGDLPHGRSFAAKAARASVMSFPQSVNAGAAADRTDSCSRDRHFRRPKSGSIRTAHFGRSSKTGIWRPQRWRKSSLRKEDLADIVESLLFEVAGGVRPVRNLLRQRSNPLRTRQPKHCGRDS
jgi:hypothetical protein